MNTKLLINPLTIFAEWFEKAKSVEKTDATAMALATANAVAQPSVRIVLLKSYDEDGFVFYTNLASQKAKELLENPHAALCFFWQILDKQVRIEGEAELVTDSEADAYFATRPIGSQIGAWASKQSAVMQNTEELLVRVKKFETRFHDAVIPRPEFWSGFRLKPTKIEFWQRGDNRLHERICFYKTALGWERKFLFP